jgi:Ca2+-dependent lipid-binding protein
MSDSLGTLTITCIEAHLTRDVQKIGKMDPYVRFWSRGNEYKIADWRHRTKVHEDGGKKPKWNDTFTIDVKYLGDDLHYAVLDDDRGKDDEVGNGSQKISAFCINGGIDEWFEVEHKDKSAGKIHLKATWAPRRDEHPQQNLIDEAQTQIRVLAAKKHELETEYHSVGERIHAHETEGKARLAALAGDNDDEFNGRHSAADAELAAAQAKFENDARLADEAKEAFE